MIQPITSLTINIFPPLLTHTGLQTRHVSGDIKFELVKSKLSSVYNKEASHVNLGVTILWYFRIPHIDNTQSFSLHQGGNLTWYFCTILRHGICIPWYFVIANTNTEQQTRGVCTVGNSHDNKELSICDNFSQSNHL
ncbi:hypothetical protein ACJX0J_036530 [Zea mays]